MSVYTPTFAEYLHVNATELGHHIINNQCQWYSQDGFWHSSYESSWNQQVNTAALAACMWRYTDKSDPNHHFYRQMAIDTVERGFRLCFYESTNSPGTYRFTFGMEGQNDEALTTGDTINFEAISAIGGVMHYLGDSLDRATRRRWSTNLSLVLDYFSTPPLPYPYYYINGNYAFHLMANYWEVAEACRLCGDMANWRKHYANYQTMYNVVITPYPTISLHFGLYEPDGITPYTLWQGFGLVVDGGVKNEDWSQYTAHLSETAQGPVHGVPPAATWDPAYSMLTMDLFANFFCRNRDFRVMQLLNAEHNKLEPLINTTLWTINANGGSRQSGIRGYIGCWLQVIYLIGQRAFNRTLFTEGNMQSSFQAMSNNLKTNEATGTSGPGTQRQYQIAVATLIECAAIANKEIL